MWIPCVVYDYDMTHTHSMCIFCMMRYIFRMVYRVCCNLYSYTKAHTAPELIIVKTKVCVTQLYYNTVK